MLSSIGGNSSLQSLYALNAFKADSSSAPKNVGASNQAEIHTSNGINLTDDNKLLNEIDITEIKNCAQKVGEMDLSEEDIKYGLTYGRSVIADYVA